MSILNLLEKWKFVGHCRPKWNQHIGRVGWRIMNYSCVHFLENSVDPIVELGVWNEVVNRRVESDDCHWNCDINQGKLNLNRNHPNSAGNVLRMNSAPRFLNAHSHWNDFLSLFSLSVNLWDGSSRAGSPFGVNGDWGLVDVLEGQKIKGISSPPSKMCSEGGDKGDIRGMDQ